MEVKYTLTGTTLTEGMGGYKYPLTLTLTSVDAGRKIEISTDETNFYQPTYETTQTDFITLVLNAPVSKFKLTGAINDIATIIF